MLCVLQATTDRTFRGADLCHHASVRAGFAANKQLRHGRGVLSVYTIRDEYESRGILR